MRRLHLVLSTLAALALTACGGGNSGTDDTDGGGNDQASSCAASDGVSPSVVSATFECRVEDVSDPPVETIIIEATVTDPQGDFTLQRFGDHSLKAYLAANDSLAEETDTLFCDQDNAGSCGGSVSAGVLGLSCGTVNNYYFTVQFADDEGNLSPECRIIEQ